MDVLWFWVLILLLVIAIFAWPTWPYTRERWLYRYGPRWRYAPSGTAALGFLVVLLLFWLGVIVIAWPWYAVQPAYTVASPLVL